VCGLYLVVPSALAAENSLDRLAEDLAAALEAGDIACVLLRTGGLDDRTALRAARRLGPIAQARDVAFLVEDRPEVARDGGADGLHMSRADAPVATLREAVGPEAIVGLSCGRAGVTLETAAALARAGADFLALEDIVWRHPEGPAAAVAAFAARLAEAGD
jgi:thiamine-phosphate pyrophosphorylase